MKVSTIPEFFEKYYDTKGRVISAVGLVIIMSVITALQYLAGGADSGFASARIFLVPRRHDSKRGGIYRHYAYRRLVVEWFVQYRQRFLIYAGILYSCVAAVDHSGGIENIAAQLPAGLDWFDPFAGIPLAVIIGWFIVMITQAITAAGPCADCLRRA